MSSTPAIQISEHLRRHPSHSSSAQHSSSTSSSSSVPMAIPRAGRPVPPPLPPPHFIPGLTTGHDPGWQWGNDPSCPDFGRPAAPLKPGSSLLGGQSVPSYSTRDSRSFTHNAASHSRRGSSASTVTVSRDLDMTDDSPPQSDEERSSSSRQHSNYRLHGERQLEQRTLEDSSKDYDKQLLSRIGGPNTPKRQSLSYPSSSGVQEAAQLAYAEGERRCGQLRPLTVADRRHTSADSPASARWPTSIPSSAAHSPAFTGFWEHSLPEHSRGQTRHSSLQSDELHPHRGSYDQSLFLNDDFTIEDGNLGSLNIHDRSPSRADDPRGLKRRASSPPRGMHRDDRPSTTTSVSEAELLHRRSTQQQLQGRDSPISRFHPSFSPASSYSGARHGSLASSLGVPSVPSSATSYGSGGVSPNGPFSVGEAELSSATAYSKTVQVVAIPPNPHHQRSLSNTSQGILRKSSSDSIVHSRRNSITQSVSGGYMCECCPKKPRKFDNEEELRLHESEKHYTCAYCPNRFKNKNEAERHQNSLHLRKQSWSCAAILGIEAVFHPSPSSNGTDSCGYCGEEFSSPPQWDMRAQHLGRIHKFGECNQTKKFYRADHFRQHLKHSHAGTSGKWTNVLEAACMKDEPAPEKRATQVAAVQQMAHSHPALVVSTSGLSSLPIAGHATIQETPHDS